ncbi:MAG TPA: hypothetical protein VM390_00220 [Acidimicrobiales bacterium]|nr:hypothetical protein [Acidimicrobiales bacterium]
MGESGTSTAPPDVPVRRLRRARLGRRVFFVLVCGVLAAGAFGLLGVSSAHREAAGGGYRLTVTYDERTRPGLATSLQVEVSRPGGFTEAVALSVTSAYFDSLDFHGLDPQPLGATSTAEDLILYFEPPRRGETLVVGFDARIQPNVQLRRARATVSVLDGQFEPVASVPIETLVLP